MNVKTIVSGPGKILAKGGGRQATVAAENTSQGHATAAFAVLDKLGHANLPGSAVKGAQTVTKAGMTHGIVFEIEV